MSEARQHGASKNAAKGYPLFGPLSSAQGELEFRRLLAVYESIREHGIVIDKEGFNNVEAVCLVDDRAEPVLRFFILNGQHRTAAVAALAYDYVDLQIRAEGPGGLIRRSEAAYWPTVRNGYLTEEEAVGIFDRLFASKQPPLFNQSGIIGDSDQQQRDIAADASTATSNYTRMARETSVHMTDK